MLKIANDVKEFQAEDECVVYFTAEWCGPCKQLKPQYARASVLDESLNYYMVDVDKINADELKSYGVQSIPQVFVMQKGQIVKPIKSRTAEAILEELKK